MDIREPIELDGRHFSKEALRSFARAASTDPTFPGWKQDIFAFIALFLDPDEKEILQPTSGTTGDPKQISLSRKAMVISARRSLDYFRLEQGMHVLLALSVNYIAGKMMVVRALVGGLKLSLKEPSGRPLEGWKDKLDFTAMVPLQVHESLAHKDPLQKISILLVGGGELNPDDREVLATYAANEVYESFGMTETYTHFALRKVIAPGKDNPFKFMKGVKGSLDKRGCLEIEIPGITEGLLQSNDLVELDGSSGFHWLGRYDHVINSGCVKLIPEIMESRIAKLLGHPCLLLAEPDPKLGERAVLMVEYMGKDASTETWMKILHEALSSYEKPARIVSVQALPLNNNYKPDRTRAAQILLNLHTNNDLKL